MLLEMLSGIVNMSMTASIVIIAVLLLRLVLRKAPKVYSYLLWFIVLFRLLCPVSISSAVSLMGMFDTPVTEEGVITYIPYVDNSVREITAVNFEIIPDGLASEEMHGVEKTETTYDLQEILVTTGVVLWIAGVVALLIYSIFSLVRLLKKLVGSVKVEDGIYRADHIVTPFVMGIIYPRIYLPSKLTETEKNYILMHEKHHIKRGDHIFKILFYMTLCVYWFNPLVWVAFYLFVKDMEMSCDEAVMRRMMSDIRAEYSEALLCLATGRRMMTGMPLAFGEGDTRARIKNILKWKKPKKAAVIAAMILCVAAAACLVTNPKVAASGMNIASGDAGSSPGMNDAFDDAEYASAVEALRAAVIRYYQAYAVPADFSCAGIMIRSVDMFVLADEMDARKTAVYYIYAMYKDMDLKEDGVKELVTISAAPMVITLIWDADGGYRVEEDGIVAVNDLTGEDYKACMQENFPESYHEDGSRKLSDLYKMILCMDCHAQAVEYGQLDTDAIIGGLVDHIAGEPLASSATQDYIRNSPVEYRELIYYGNYTIAYAEAYRQTGAADLKMAILDCAEAEIRMYIERPDEAQQERNELNVQIVITEQERNELNALQDQLNVQIAITEQERNELIALQELNELIAQLGMVDGMIASTELELNKLIAR